MVNWSLKPKPGWFGRVQNPHAPRLTWSQENHQITLNLDPAIQTEVSWKERHRSSINDPTDVTRAYIASIRESLYLETNLHPVCSVQNQPHRGGKYNMLFKKKKKKKAFTNHFKFEIWKEFDVSPVGETPWLAPVTSNNELVSETTSEGSGAIWTAVKCLDRQSHTIQQSLHELFSLCRSSNYATRLAV